MPSIGRYRFVSSRHGPLTALRRLQADEKELTAALPRAEALRVIRDLDHEARRSDRSPLIAIAGLAGDTSPRFLPRLDTSYFAQRVVKAVDRGDVLLVRGWSADAPVVHEEQPVVPHRQPKPRARVHRYAAPVAQESPPPPKPRPQPVEKPVCKVVSITAGCAHGRKVKAGETLEIVPGHSLGSDQITLTDHVDNAHGSDPTWTLSEGSLQGKSFKATGPTTSKLWIPSISPRAYVASCATCSGSSESLTLHAYPNNELKAEVDFDKILKIVEKLTDWFKELLDIVTEKVEFEVLHVKGSFAAQWKEAEDWRAFYAYKISVDGDLLKASFKQMIGPSKIVNVARKIPGVGKYLGQVIDWLVKAGIYLEISGAVKASFKFERTKPAQPRWVKNLGAGVGGALELALGVMASVLHDEVIAVKLEAKGGVTFAGEGELGEHGGIEITPKLDFDGLKGEASVRLLRGWITVSQGLTLVEPRPLWQGQAWEIGAAAHEGGGGGD